MRGRLVLLSVAGLISVGLAFIFLVKHHEGGYRAAGLEVDGVGMELDPAVRPIDVAAQRRSHGYRTINAVSSRNGSKRFSARIESIKAITSPNAEATKPRVWLEPKRLAHMSLPYATFDWPPTDTTDLRDRAYQALLSRVPELPRTAVIPPGRTIEILFGVRSKGRPGEMLVIHAVQVDFRQHWMRYRWRIPRLLRIKT